MDDRRFDVLTKRFAHGISRRSALKGLFGLGGAAVAGAILNDTPATEAQRRPTPTPVPPQCPGNQIPCGSGCCCPGDNELCGSDCCEHGHTVCCDGACCDGVCTSGGCCPAPRSCFGACCADGERCCLNGFGCVPTGACCGDDECPGGRCIDGACVANTPTAAPTQTMAAPTVTPGCRVAADCGVCSCVDSGRRTNCPVCTDGQCSALSSLCPANSSCVGGQCVPFTATSTPVTTPTPTRTPVPPSATPTPTRAPQRAFVRVIDGQTNLVVENLDPSRTYEYQGYFYGISNCFLRGTLQTDQFGNGRSVFGGCFTDFASFIITDGPTLNCVVRGWECRQVSGRR